MASSYVGNFTNYLFHQYNDIIARITCKQLFKEGGNRRTLTHIILADDDACKLKHTMYD